MKVNLHESYQKAPFCKVITFRPTSNYINPQNIWMGIKSVQNSSGIRCKMDAFLWSAWWTRPKRFGRINNDTKPPPTWTTYIQISLNLQDKPTSETNCEVQSNIDILSLVCLTLFSLFRFLLLTIILFDKQCLQCLSYVQSKLQQASLL